MFYLSHSDGRRCRFAGVVPGNDPARALQRQRRATRTAGVTKLSVIAVIASLLAGGAMSAFGGCSTETPHGNDAFTITGQILRNPAPANVGAVAGVAVTAFDGAGNLTQVDHVVHNGNVPAAGWRPATGSYTLDGDCTITMTLLFSDGSPNRTMHIAVSNLGTQVRTVVDGPVAVTSTGTRVGWAVLTGVPLRATSRRRNRSLTARFFRGA